MAAGNCTGLSRCSCVLGCSFVHVAIHFGVQTAYNPLLLTTNILIFLISKISVFLLFNPVYSMAPALTLTKSMPMSFTAKSSGMFIFLYLRRHFIGFIYMIWAGK